MSEVFGDDADEALDGAQHHAVDHHGAVLLAVLAGILQLEALRQLAVQLDGAALPGAAQESARWKSSLGP